MNKTFLYSVLLVTSFAYGVDSQLNTLGPSLNNDNSFVKDSEMTKDEYTKGTHYNVKLGSKSRTKVLDSETGTSKIIDNSGNIVIRGQDNNLSEGYRNALHDAMWVDGLDGNKEFVGGLNKSLESSSFNQLSEAQKDAVRIAKEESLKLAKIEREKELDRKGHNQTNRESIFLKGLSSNAKGEGTASRFRQSKRNPNKDEFGKKYIDDTNSTEFYNNNFSYQPWTNNQSRVTDSKVNSLISAYNNVESMKDLMRSQTESTTIECFISRDLIEAYYCPMSDRNQILFPDFLNGGATIDDATHFSSSEAMSKCQESCSKRQGCRGLTLQSDTAKVFTFDKEIYPIMSQNQGEFTLDVSNVVQSSLLSFDIVIEGDESFNGDIEKLDKFLSDFNEALKVKYTVVNKESSGVVLPEAVTLLTTQKLDKSVIRVNVSIKRQSDRFILKIFKPYIYPVTVPQNQRVGESEFFDKINKISIKNIKMEYSSNKAFFCPGRQIITNASDCESSEILHINQNGQIFDVCLDNSHKIGDDINTGGFFEESACEASCSFREDCQTTYKHYSEIIKKKVYKTSIGCVNSDSNIGCKDEYCESLFSDPEIQPVSELTINSKDERVYTIKNFLATDIKRPKIDLVGEENVIEEEDFENVFQKEMKDAAYQNMINKQTFNRLKYKIGQMSPEQYAHVREQTEIGNQFRGLIRYKQDRIDDGNNYNVYAVVELESQYRLRYGQFFIPNASGLGNTILNAEVEPIMLLEKTYLIKKSDGSWKTFKKVFKDKIQKERKYKYCPDGDSFSATLSISESLTTQDINNHCYLQSEITWESLSDYRKEEFVKYYNHELKVFSSSENAEYFHSGKVDSSTEIKEYLITDSMERVLSNTNGVFIRDQITEDDGLSTTEQYSSLIPFNGFNRSQVYNYKLYLFTAERDISYKNIMEFKLNDKSLVYDHINRNQSRTVIKDDGTINNGIKAYLMGTSEKSSLILDLKPKFNEEGKRAFQFMFLYNERETSLIE